MTSDELRELASECAIAYEDLHHDVDDLENRLHQMGFDIPGDFSEIAEQLERTAWKWDDAEDAHD